MQSFFVAAAFFNLSAANSSSGSGLIIFSLATSISSFTALSPALIISILIWVATILQYWFAFDAVLTNFSLWAVLLALSAAYLSIIISITPGNFGAFHAIIIAVLINFDITESYSLIIATVIHFFNFILCLFFGLVSYYFISTYEQIDKK